MTQTTRKSVPGIPARPDDDPRIKLLTRREREVMTLIGHGLSTSHIADQLHLSMKTIKSHRWNLGKKLNVSNRVELARIAIEVGLSPLTGPTRENAYELNAPQSEKIDYWSQILRGIHEIEANISAAPGENYFPTLVKQLAVVLDAQCVFVGRVTGKKKTALQISAFWIHSKPGKNFKFPLSGTPCGRSFSEGKCFRYSDVRNEFIIPEPVSHLASDGYVGVALHDDQGEPIGVLAAYFDKLIAQDAQPEIILQNFATRAGLELQSKPDQPARQTARGVIEHVPSETGNYVSAPIKQQLQDHNGANEVLRREVDKRLKAEMGIQILVESSILTNGEGYFQMLVTLLAKALQVKHAFISTIDGETNGTAGLLKKSRLAPNALVYCLKIEAPVYRIVVELIFSTAPPPRSWPQSLSTGLSPDLNIP